MFALIIASQALAGTCSTYGDLEPVVTFDDLTELDEASGLAISPTRGVMYTHEDAGGEAEIYAFQADGTSRGTHVVEGASFRDWEDISLGPCHDDPAQPCLYIGDIGDNGHDREHVTVYEVREPTVDDETLTVIATWNGTYADYARDAEALMVHPLTGRIYLATKDPDGDEEIYRFAEIPSAFGETTPLELVTSFVIASSYDKLVNGGDFDPEGERLVLRTYSSMLEWMADPCDPDATWDGPYTVSPLSGEKQGEAIAYDRGSGDLYTVSERLPMGLFRMACEGLYTRTDATCDGGDTGDTGDTGGGETGLDTGAAETGLETGPETGPETGRDSGDVVPDSPQVEETADTAAHSGAEDTGEQATDDPLTPKTGCACGGTRSSWLILPLLWLPVRRRRGAGGRQR